MSLFLKTFFQFFLPPQCSCCETFLAEGQEGFCADCLSAIHWIEPPFCTRCGLPFVSREGENHLCGVCLEERRYFTMGRALGYYEGPLREAIHRWKYEGKIYLSPLFGNWMAQAFFQYWENNLFDLLVPVPLHPQRLRKRGFNQALLLTRELSRRTGIPYRKRILEKRRPTTPQVDLSGREREKGVKGAFHLANVEGVREKAILLIDDVYTTGATVNECSKVLMAGGAKRVDVFTLAHTLMNS
jgi:ComF family protein